MTSWRGGSASRKITPDGYTGGSTQECESCRKAQRCYRHATLMRHTPSRSQQRNCYPFGRPWNQTVNAKQSSVERSWAKPAQKKRPLQLSELEIRYSSLF